MKKIFALGWMLVAALALTNCSKEETFTEEPISGAVYEIVSNPETRTTNDGMNTKWAAEDAVNVFYAETGSEVYVDNNSFTISEENLSTGKFLGTLTEALDINKSYDWFMFYPYSSYIKSPANYDTGYSYIGGRSDRKQSQKGINNMDHIAGTNYPMTGKVSGVAGSETPAITMKHISALIAVNVTNSTDTAINVSEVAVTVDGESLVGTFYYNQVTGEYTDGGYVSNTATLAVTDGTIAAGANGIFYLATKPFYLDETDFTVNIVTEEGATVSKTIAPIGVAFNAGKIKTVNITVNEDNIEYPEPSIDYTQGIFELVTDASTLQAGDAIIIAAAKANVAMLAAQDSNNRKAGAVSKENNYIMYPDATIQVFTLEGSAGAWEFNTGNGYIYAASSGSNYLKTQITNNDNGKWNIIIDSAGTTMTAIGNNTRNALRYNSTSTLFSCYSSNTTQEAISLYKYVEDLTLTPLATPEVTATVQNQNEIVVSWDDVENAGSYKVTCGDKNATVEGETSYTFTNLAYDTEYAISVMAVPTDVTKYSPSTGNATAKTEVKQTTGTSTTATFVCKDAFEYSGSGATGIFTATDGTITITQAKGTSSNDIGPTYNNPLRVYVGHTLTFEGLNSENITEIVFTYNTGKTPKALKIKEGDGSFNLNGTVGTWINDAGATKVVLTTDTQVRFDKIEVTYTK